MHIIKPLIVNLGLQSRRDRTCSDLIEDNAEHVGQTNQVCRANPRYETQELQPLIFGSAMKGSVLQTDIKPVSAGGWGFPGGV